MPKGTSKARSFKLRIFPGAHHIGQYSPCVMIKRMPQPPCLLFGPDETPHFIELGGAFRWDAAGA